MKAQCGFDDTTIFRLEPYDVVRPHDVGSALLVQSEGSAPCGTYRTETHPGGGVVEVISYDTGLADDPTGMVATFAHELSHALHHRARLDWPVEAELYELWTDLTAIYLGFGVFLANSRFSFQQFQDTGTQGWQAKGAGYLPEADMVFGTALFARVKGTSLDGARKHLKPKLAKLLPKAERQLDSMAGEVEALRERIPVLARETAV